MNSSTTTKLQPTKTYYFEQVMLTEPRGSYRKVLETCKALSQKQGVHSTITMNSAGFHYAANDDTVRCDTCKLQVSGWTSDMNPFTIHAQRSPTCAFVRSILPTEQIAATAMITFHAVTAESNTGAIQGKRQSNILIELK